MSLACAVCIMDHHGICQVSRVLKDFCSARSSVIGFLQAAVTAVTAATAATGDSSVHFKSLLKISSIGGQLFKGVFCRRGTKLITANLSMFHGFE